MDRRRETVRVPRCLHHRIPVGRNDRPRRGAGAHVRWREIVTAITATEHLARLGRFDPELLAPLRHRSASAQADLQVLRSRDALVRARTMFITHVRGALRALHPGPVRPRQRPPEMGTLVRGVGARNAKKRAVVAVARRLAVPLLALWKTGEANEPLRQARERREPHGRQAGHGRRCWSYRCVCVAGAP